MRQRKVFSVPMPFFGGPSARSLVRRQELAEDEGDDHQPGQHGQPHDPRALMPAYYRDESLDSQ